MTKKKKSNQLVEIPIEQKILQTDDVDELQSLINVFNLNLKKKDIIRSAKLNEVQDKIVEQMSDRISSRADEFSNADLLNYHKVIQDTISKTDNNLDDVNVPNIQINQQLNINNTGDSFDRESRKKILSAVDEILNDLSNLETDKE